MRRGGLVGLAAEGTLPLSALLVALLTACAVTVVELTEKGKMVRVGTSAVNAKGCDAVARIAGYSTNMTQDIDQQRTMNAQNRAAELGANLIVPGQATLMTVGGREFEAYRCPL